MSKGKITSLPLAALVEDLTIYPRHVVDEAHVANLVQAIRAGATMPPVVVDEASKRLVDGWHRARAYRRVKGPAGRIPAEVRTYPNEAALLIDAVALNASHGRRLDRIDQVRAVLLLEGAGVARTTIAATLQVPDERVEKLRIRIAHLDDPDTGEIRPVILKRPLLHFSGQEITAAQAAAQERQGGTSYLLQVRQLTEALENDLLNREDERLLAALHTLQGTLTRFLASGTLAA